MITRRELTPIVIKNVRIPVQIPVDICGNAVGLLGFANASCVGGAAALPDDSGN